MKKVIRLTERDLTNIIKRVIKESQNNFPDPLKIAMCLSKMSIDVPPSCTGSFFPPQTPDPGKCVTEIISKIGDKKSELEKCLGTTLEIPTNTPVMNEHRRRLR